MQTTPASSIHLRTRPWLAAFLPLLLVLANFAPLSTTTALAQASPLSLQITANPDPVVIGGRLQYTLTVSNKGSGALANVVVKATTPTYLQMYNFACTPAPDDGYHFYPGNTITWTIGTLPAGQSQTIQASMTVDSTPADGTSLIFNASVTATNTQQVNALCSLPTNTSPVLTLQMAADKNPVVANGTSIYTIVFGNRGNVSAPSVALNALLPIGTVFVSADGGITPVGGMLQWPLGTLVSGQSGWRQFKVTVAAGTASGTLLHSDATITDTIGNEADASSDVAVGSSPLSFIISASPDPLQTGGRLQYTLVVSNKGGADLANVVVDATMPTYLQMYNYDCTPAPDDGYHFYPGNTITWTIGTLPAGQSQTIQASMTVDSTATYGTILNLVSRVTATNVQQARASCKVAMGYYGVTASPSPIGCGTTTGSGGYPNGSTATLTAKPIGGGSFIKWTENGVTVSTSPTYTFTVTSSRNFVANFTTTRIIALSGNMAFGSVPLGTAKTSVLTIKNNGNTTLNITGITYPFGTYTGNFIGNIAAGSFRNVTVTFKPTALQNYPGTLTVNSNKTSGTNTLPISGTGVAATRIIGLSGTMAFGHVAVGYSKTSVLTIKNTGNSPLKVTGITYPAGGFSGAYAGTIPIGGSQPVTVTFKPATVGTFTGTLIVISDKTSGTNTLPISGVGDATASRIIGLSGTMAFGHVAVGYSKTSILTIKNTGNSPLSVTSITYPAGFSGAFAGTIPIGGSHNVTVTFKPTLVQTYTGTLTVSSNKTSGTNTLPISGVGDAVATRVIGLSGNMVFGSIPVGSTKTSVLTIKNTGNSPLTVTSISYPGGMFSGTYAGAIPIGGTQTVTVTFRPTAHGTYYGSLTVYSNKTSGTNTLPISGTGL